MRFQDIFEPTLTVVIFDIETTGLDVNKDRIVQLGAKRYHNGEFEEFKVLVNPLIPIPHEAAEVHGIRDEDVADSPAFAELSTTVMGLFQGVDIVLTYNGKGFDVPLLIEEFIRVGIDPLPFIEIPKLDVRDLVRRYFSQKLSNVYKLLFGKVDFEEHDALGDVNATESIAAKLVELCEFGNLTKALNELYPNSIGGSTSLVWGEEHAIYLTSGKYSLLGDTPLSLLEIWQKERWYWDRNILGPINGKFTGWKGILEAQIIDLFKNNPQAMVQLVSENYPPEEEFCEQWEYHFIEGENGMVATCSECGREFEDSSIFDEYMDAMAEMHQENQFDAWREEGRFEQGGDGLEE